MPVGFGPKMMSALHVLGSTLYTLATDTVPSSTIQKKKNVKKTEEEEAREKDHLAEIVRILGPILPNSVLEPVSNSLYQHANDQLSELFETFGTLQDPKKVKIRRALKREDSHVSEDNKVYRKDERRNNYMK